MLMCSHFLAAPEDLETSGSCGFLWQDSKYFESSSFGLGLPLGLLGVMWWMWHVGRTGTA